MPAQSTSYGRIQSFTYLLLRALASTSRRVADPMLPPSHMSSSVGFAKSVFLFLIMCSPAFRYALQIKAVCIQTHPACLCIMWYSAGHSSCCIYIIERYRPPRSFAPVQGGVLSTTCYILHYYNSSLSITTSPSSGLRAIFLCFINLNPHSGERPFCWWHTLENGK